MGVGSLQLSSGVNRTVTSVIGVTNNGTLGMNVTFSNFTLTSGQYAVMIDPIAAIELMPNMTTNVSVRLAIPAYQMAGLYTGAVHLHGGGYSASLPVSLNILQNPSLAITPAELNFGSISRNSSPAMAFRITNNGNFNLSGMSAVANFEGGYTGSFNETIASLAVNHTRAFELRIHVPQNSDTGEINVGAVAITAASTAWSIPITARLESRLEITDFDLTIDGDTSYNLKDAEKVDSDVKPESELIIDVKIDNTFTGSDDIDINDITVTALIKYIDEGDDLEDESSSFDLAAAKDIRVKFEFDIPLNVDGDEYDIVVTAEGVDEKGGKHYDTQEISITVDKKTHDLKIRRAELNPLTVKCGQSSSLFVQVMNQGKRDEDLGILSVRSDALDLNVRESMSLDNRIGDSDNVFERTYAINVPDNTKTGTYNIDIRSYYDFSQISDVRIPKLTVTECGAVTETGGGSVGDLVTGDDKGDEFMLPRQSTGPGRPGPQVIVTDLLEAADQGEEGGTGVAWIVSVMVFVTVIIVVLGVLAIPKSRIKTQEKPPNDENEEDAAPNDSSRPKDYY
ncbi:MAG: hypothetical protein ABH879_04200 [archaeon]